MKAQQYIIRGLLVAAMVISFIFVSILFIRWLYLDNSSEEALTVFSDTSINVNSIEKYSNNIYISIINNTMPSVKVSYENKYGQSLRGISSNIFSNMLSGANFDIRDPKTYFNFVFTAFSQYDENSNVIAINNEGNDIPTIRNFDEAPKGEIYFNDEMEEYMADEEVENGETAGDASQSSEVLIVPDPNRLEIEKKQPSVLILHTHSTEAYTPFTTNNYHSGVEKQSVIEVGNIITDVLESKYKYNVIHDKTKHDKISYADSYINASKTLASQLDKNKTVQVIMDIHRDAFEIKNKADAQIKKNDYTVTIGGKNAARIMLVIGSKNDNFSELQKFAAYVQRKMDKLYPGLFLKTLVKPRGTYNQFYREHSLLVEVGCTLNTNEEAAYSAELFGNVMGEVLKDLEQ